MHANVFRGICLVSTN